MAWPDSLVIDIAGDGSFQMTLQELATAVQYNLPVKVCILNNQYLGMVRQWQELFWNKRYSSHLHRVPARLRQAGRGLRRRGLPGEPSPRSSKRCCAPALASDRPAVIDIRVKREANVFPMIPAGRLECTT